VPSPRRILLIRLSHLGDVVQALPVYHALRGSFPEAALAWAVQTEFADLLRGLPGLERVIPFDRKGGLGAWARLRADLADFAPDWAVDAQGNSKSALVALASGAPRRTGPAREHWQEFFAAGTCTDLAPSPAGDGEPLHSLERVFLLARHVAARQADAGLETTMPQAAWRRRDPCLSDAEREAGRRSLTAHIINGGENGQSGETGDGNDGAHSAPSLLHLSRASDTRSWPAASFAALADLLVPHRQVLVLAGPAESAEAAILEARGIPVLRQEGIRELAALFAAAAERRGCLIACDSGPAHLAAAVDLSVLLLAGPRDARLTGPWPVPLEGTGPARPGRTAGPHRAVRVQGLDCAPCRSRTCHHPRGPVCMGDLSPDTVAAMLISPTRSLAPRAITR
jgi:ADP-heptose:LPS heptosyltransferase